MTARRVLIAGCGDVGTALGLALVSAGHRVWGLRRDPSGLPPPLAPLAADLARPETLRVVPAEVDTVVYAAAADAFDEAAYRRAYVDGVRNLLSTLRARGGAPGRVVYASSTAVYGQSDGSWVDESSPTEPAGFSGRVLLEGEATVREAGPVAVIVRLAGIYGPGRGRLLAQVRAGTATVPPDGPRWTNRIHRDDAVGALAHLVALPDAAGVWIASDHEPADRGALLRWLADRLGAPPPRMAAERRSERPVTNKRCRNAKLVASGYVFRHPTFREGYASSITVQNA